MKIKFYIVLFGIMLLVKTPTTAVSQTDSSIQAQIDKIASDYLSNPDNVGLIIGIYPKPDPRSMNATPPAPQVFAYGEVQKGTGVRPNEKTIFKMGSVGKTFTAMQLAHYVCNPSSGVLLTDPINKYLPAGMTLPEWRDANGNITYITLLDLATHFSSLPRVPSNRVKPPGYTVEMLYAYLQKYKLKSQPGTKFLYSNLGFGILGDIMTIIGKNDYQTLENQIFTDALGMVDTKISLNQEQLTRLAYSYSKGKEQEFYGVTSPAFYGAGGNFSTMTDMLKYLAYNMGYLNTPLNSYLDTLHKVRMTTGLKNLKWMGLAWQIGTLNNNELIWKDGSTDGFTTWVGWVDATKTGVVILSNTNGASGVAMKVMNVLQ
ncbi:MAG TPA: serine hydrolase [Ignavibacteria bacterium]|nr:serine hydrolase [Ignavibacteria bacterium]